MLLPVAVHNRCVADAYFKSLSLLSSPEFEQAGVFAWSAIFFDRPNHSKYDNPSSKKNVSLIPLNTAIVRIVQNHCAGRLLAKDAR